MARNTGPAAPMFVQPLQELTAVYLRTKDNAGGEEALRQVLAEYEKSPRPHGAIEAAISIQLGHILLANEKYEEARVLYSRVRAKLSDGDRTKPEKILLNATDYSLAVIARKTGSYAEADSLFETAVQGMEELGLTDRPEYRSALAEREEVKKLLSAQTAGGGAN